MIEPRLLKIEAVDEPERIIDPAAPETPNKTSRTTTIRSLFNRLSSSSARPADDIRI